jgi:hypothetical protein
MGTSSKKFEVAGLPPYVGSWSVVGIPNFVVAVLNRWQRNYGGLPARFVLVTCPQVEIHAAGGLPARVRELTDSRVRILHFTACHKPYLVFLLLGDDAETRRSEIQKLLSWSEGYRVELGDGKAHLQFVEAVEHID